MATTESSSVRTLYAPPPEAEQIKRSEVEPGVAHRNGAENGAEPANERDVVAEAAVAQKEVVQWTGSPLQDVEGIVIREEERSGDSETQQIQPAAPTRKVKRVKKFYARDFMNSSWVIGILWAGKRSVQTTKIYMREDGSLVWLDKGKGSWRLDTKTRYFGFYRDFFLGWKGKRIFSARLADNCNEHYISGIIKGWTPWHELKVMGQFQMVREGVDLTKHGRPPWETEEIPEELADEKPIVAQVPYVKIKQKEDQE